MFVHCCTTYSHEDEQIIAQATRDESHQYNAEQNKLCPKEYQLYDAIDINLSNR